MEALITGSELVFAAWSLSFAKSLRQTLDLSGNVILERQAAYEFVAQTGILARVA